MFYGDKTFQKINSNEAAVLLDSEKFRWQGTSGDHVVQPPTHSRASLESNYSTQGLVQLSFDIKTLNCLNLTLPLQQLITKQQCQEHMANLHTDVSSTTLTRS